MVSFILFRLEHRSGKFWESLTDIANTLKLRVSYGELGNQNTTAWYPTYRDMILNHLTEHGCKTTKNLIQQNLVI